MHIRPLPVHAVVVLSLLLLTTPSHAQSAAAQQGPEVLAAQAQAAAGRGDFALAANLWEAAYQQQGSPEYLFSLGEACGHLQGAAMTFRALRAYRRYLVEDQQPHPSQHERATAAIHELTQRQARARAEQGGSSPEKGRFLRGIPAAPALSETPRTGLPEASQPLSMTLPSQLVVTKPPPRRSRLRMIGIGLLGAGVVLGSVGGILISSSIATAKDARQADSFALYMEVHQRALNTRDGGGACLALAGLSIVGGTVALGLWSRQTGTDDGREVR